eukprot:CAMPEP_0205810966 /NCGR_PEP_ID=MMETSP0205-20121125/15120_1 /ASSEMBLY_ACC=CAM_ASM_000278 /TAXON_ID=36767 /ORGANISM="Euplotes focardii, Strain TN1" /LENGTH=198 /DNA_ID=CAMNT_0053089573 /DNA_START=102 /DNA_END=695 /DNA_ORIENTATION=+
MKVRMSPKEPKVNILPKSRRNKPITYSIDKIHNRNISKYSTTYAPKYRQSPSHDKINKHKSNYKIQDKENMSRNAKRFSPIISMSENESDHSKDRVTHNKTTKKGFHKSSLSAAKKNSYGKFIKKPVVKKENLQNPDVQKLVQMNLDLIQAFSKGIEASRSIISSLASPGNSSKEDLNKQIKTIETLSKEFNSTKYSS